MPNSLTGDFDVAVEFSLHSVNRVLAAIHQNERGPVTFLHSFAARVDDEATRVHGTTQVQVSAPSLSLPAPDARSPDRSRVTVHYQVMARFLPDTGSASLPESVHGELQVTADAGQRILPDMGHVIQVDFRSADIQVAFNPSPGTSLSTEQRERMNQVLHNFMSHGFEPENMRMDLPPDVYHLGFKTMPGSNPAVALLLNLRDVSPGDNALSRITDIFLQTGDHFAIAVGRDYLIPLLLENISRQVQEQLSGAATVEGIDIELQTGRILLTIRGFGDACLGSVNFTLSQALSLHIRDNGVVVREPLPAPEVTTSGRSGLGFVVAGQAADRLRSEIGARQGSIVAAANGLIGERLGRLNLSDLLQRFGIAGAGAIFTSVEILPAGIVLHNSLSLPPWRRPVVALESPQVVTVDGSEQWEFSALPSWIPGGTIQEYQWAGAGVERHTFTKRVPTNQFAGPGQLCVTLVGRRITASGTPAEERVSERLATRCAVITPGGQFPPELEWLDQRKVLESGIIRLDGTYPDPPSRALGHVDLTRFGTNRVNQNMNWIVHFAEPQSADSLQLLLNALASSGKKGSAVLVVAVVSPEQLAKMGPLPVNIENTALAWADDIAGVWRKAFAVEATPATYIVQATGQIVWRQMGKSDPSTLTAAFDDHLMPGGQLGWQMLRLAVQAGALAPDFLFAYESGQEIALRKLRGRPVLVTFWKWWSPPCLSELRALQTLYDTYGHEGLIVLAIHDGEDQQQAPALFKQYGFTFRLILDTERKIANLYGVCGWPTTMSIDEEGVVDGIQIGLAGA